MMRWDNEDWVFVGVAVVAIAMIAFIWMASGKIDDCAKRGGYAVETSAGLVCAKLEKV